MGKKSEIPAEKRIELVLSLLRKEEPAAQIARRAGVSEPTLYRWRDEFINGGKAQLRGKGGEAQSTKELSRLQREIERLARRQRALRDALRERRPVDELHDDRRSAVAALEPVDVRDVLVIQRGEHFGLALQAREPVRVRHERFRQHLERDIALQVRVGGPVDLAHAPHADQRGDFVLAEARPRGQRHREPNLRQSGRAVDCCSRRRPAVIACRR